MNIQHDPLRWYALAYKRASLTPWFLKPSGDQDWLYRWGCPECGTSKPTAQLGHSTLFLRWDGKDGTVPTGLSAVNLSGPDHDVLCDRMIGTGRFLLHMLLVYAALQRCGASQQKAQRVLPHLLNTFRRQRKSTWKSTLNSKAQRGESELRLGRQTPLRLVTCQPFWQNHTA